MTAKCFDNMNTYKLIIRLSHLSWLS